MSLFTDNALSDYIRVTDWDCKHRPRLQLTADRRRAEISSLASDSVLAFLGVILSAVSADF